MAREHSSSSGKSNKSYNSVHVALLLAAIIIVGLITINLVVSAAKTKPQCSDGLDNDGDGKIDMKDLGCKNLQDNDESNCGDAVCTGAETYLTCPADCKRPDSCSDTDGGNAPAVYGTASGFLGGNAYNNSDTCVDSGNLLEYFCTGNYRTSQQQTCTSGCSNGACTSSATCDMSKTDGVCPSFCSPGADADCCVQKGYYILLTNITGTSCTYGCYQTNYNPGTSPCTPCSWTPDGACPNWCSAGSDADCCTQKGYYLLLANLSVTGKIPCEVGCYSTNYNPGTSPCTGCLTTPDGTCPNWCAPGSDYDCCTKAGHTWSGGFCV